MPSALTCTSPVFPLSTTSPRQTRHLLQSYVSPDDVRTIKAIHAREIHARPKFDVVFCNYFLQSYARAGHMHEARQLFDEMSQRSLVTWTLLMTGYTRHGPAIETLKIFRKMLVEFAGILQPDSFVFATVLRACAICGKLNHGREVHCLLLKTGLEIDSFVENALVTMYARCCRLKDSGNVFAGIRQPGVVSWSAIIDGYLQNGEEEEGLRLFFQMHLAGIRPDVFVFSTIIGASANLGFLHFGIQIHCYSVKMGFESGVFLENCLIDFYAKCGDLGSARNVFDKMPERNRVSWNTIITGYTYNLHNRESLEIFRELQRIRKKGEEDLYCDEFTLTSVLQAVACLGAHSHGREIHGYLLKLGFESNRFVNSALLDMYIKCIGYERSEIPLKLFLQFQSTDIELDNNFIFASILEWCSSQSDLETGKMIHCCVVKLELETDPYVVSSLIDLYAKCGIIETARRIFAGIKDPGVVPWSTTIAGYVQNGQSREALQFFREMLLNSVEPNEFTYTSIVLASVSLGDLKRGREIHCKIIRTGYESEVSVTKTLINLYSEFGFLPKALNLCSSIPEIEISWGCLIKTCARINDLETMFKMLRRIQKSSGKLDYTSACYIMKACSNPSLLNVGIQAQAYFVKTGLESEPNLSNSLINMYSCNGKFSEAAQAFNKLPEKNSSSWTLMIAAAVDHGEPSQALELFKQMRRKNKSPDSNTLISVLRAYAETGLVDQAYRLFEWMEEIYGIEPLPEHFSGMVEVLGRAGMLEDAEKFINSRYPFEPGAQTWRTLLSSCRIHGNMIVAEFAAEKILELEPNDSSASLLLEQVYMIGGKWDKALKLKTKNKFLKSENFSRIEIRNKVFEFISSKDLTEEICGKLAEIEMKMDDLRYVAVKNHWLHSTEEEEEEEAEEEQGRRSLYHSEMLAMAFGLLHAAPGMPIRVFKSVRICGDCHSRCKFISSLIDREMVVKDSCRFHHFRDGKCSCRDQW